MDLKHTVIPQELLSFLPKGILYLHKHGREFLVVEEVTCPNGHSLIVDSVKIHGEPSIKIDVRIAEQEGSFFIDAFWGSHSKLYNFIPELPKKDPVIEAYCPKCGENLIVERECTIPECSTKRHILLTLPDRENFIYVCARLGCPGHYLDVKKASKNISQRISEINYFGAQYDDDIFSGI